VCSLLELGHLSSLGHECSWLSGLWTQTIKFLYFSDHKVWAGTIPLAFLGLQLANNRSWDFLASVIV
jgi:hypothetical protein